MEKSEREIKKFKCEFSNPDFKGLPKKTERLVSNKDSKLLGLGMQVVLAGGETNRHAHTGQDAAWLVLEGRARFYGKTDDVVFRWKACSCPTAPTTGLNRHPTCR
jgi:mannose-6-phosphate isomerase-like protein (cupin superfamily)